MWLLRKVIKAPGGVRQLFYEPSREGKQYREHTTQHPAQDKIIKKAIVEIINVSSHHMRRHQADHWSLISVLGRWTRWTS